MIYIAYLRKSEEDKKRQVQSLPRQAAWCEKTASRLNVDLAHTFQDGCSAHRQGRPGFEQMMQFIENSSEPVGILTWKISRLARNPIDEGRIKDAFIRGKILHILSRDREYREGENQIIMGVDFGQATQYSIELSKDVTDGMNQKISKGYRPCLAPYGYRNDPTGLKGERKIFIDTAYFQPIQRFLKLFLTGSYSVPELRSKITSEWGLKAKNGRPFALSTLYRILESRFYTGQYEWNGSIQQGKHRPMITLQEHQRILQLLKRKQRPHRNESENHYSGLIYCAHCKSAITGYSKVKNNRFKGKTAYHYIKCTKKKNCSCPQPHLNRAALDTQLLTKLKQIKLPIKVLDFVIQTVHQAEKADVHNAVRNTLPLKKQVTSLDNQLETLTQKLLQGVVNDELYTQLSKKLTNERNRCKQQIDQAQSPTVFSKTYILKNDFEFGNLAAEKFKNGTFEERKIILHKIGSNFTLKNAELVLDLQKPFSSVRKNQALIQAQSIRIELTERLTVTGLKTNSAVEIPGWSSFLEEIRTYCTGANTAHK